MDPDALAPGQPHTACRPQRLLGREAEASFAVSSVFLGFREQNRPSSKLSHDDCHRYRLQGRQP